MFSSVTLPTLGTIVTKYHLSAMMAGNLVDLGTIDALKEYYFTSPVTEFFVDGIPDSLGLSPSQDPRWVSEVSFAADGNFTGTITALQSGQVDSVSEPTNWVLMIFGFGLVGIVRRRAEIGLNAMTH